MNDFTIRVANNDLIFSASHFITFEGGGCESLHGHDYRVTAEISGPLNSNHYVVDFAVLHGVLKKILTELDHHVLIPQNHPRIDIRSIGKVLEITLEGRRWVLPNADCVLLPLPNTTSEMLAKYVASRVSDAFTAQKHAMPKAITIEISEGNGFTAIYHSGHNE
jgi:6-pyruvoyltetrahydropterin/6-carboxytetrahydropterin synthase